MSILACIPAYNEELVIADLIKKTSLHVDQIVVCDDGSKDKTEKEAKNSGAKVIRHKKNMGKGAALKTLFDYAKKSDFDIIVTIDGDGQFLPEEIEKLTKPIIEENHDIVIGNRFSENEQMPDYRKFGNKVFDKLTSMAAELPFKDTQSGFRAYSKNAIEKISFSTNGFGADSEILINASKKNLKISEVYVTVLYDPVAKTSTKNPVSHGSEVLGHLIELIALKHPLLFIGIPGLILLMFGSYFSIWVISFFNETRYFSIPSTLVAIGSLILGLMLVLMSVVLFSIQRATQRMSHD